MSVKYLAEYWNNEENCWEFKVLDEIHMELVLSNPKYERVWYKKCTNDVPKCDVDDTVQTLYVLIDYEEGAKVIKVGFKNNVEAALEKLGNNSTGKYGIMSLGAFNIAFGKLNGCQKS